MGRRKNPPKNPAAPPAGWDPPRGKAPQAKKSTTPGDGAGTEPPPAVEPPEAARPQIRIEQVPGAKRTTFKVYGYDSAAASYVQRQRQLEQEQHELEAGKQYFRTLAKDLRANHGADTVTFCSPFGGVDVIFSETRKDLDPNKLAAAAQSGRVGTLVEQTETVKGDDWRHLLDGAFVQLPDGQWVSVRHAITSGILPLRIDRKAKVVKEFRQRVAGLGETLTPEEKLLIDDLETAGFNAAAVKVGK